MKDNEITNFSLPRYNITTKFCWNKYQKGGVCILPRKYVIYWTTDLQNHAGRKQRNRAVKIKTHSTNLISLSIYRVPSGNRDQFLELVDDTLKCLHHSSVELVLCDDINVI